MRWLNRLLDRTTPIPAPLWEECITQLPFLQRLTPDELARLKQHAETLLASKSFTGAGGLIMSDEIAVNIAAQASLPVLNLSLDLYRDMPGIVVYPAAFIVSRSEMDEAGVVHEWREPLSGEAMDAGGTVALSWQDVQDDAMTTMGGGSNVVIHEFVHKIDMLDGDANGCPPFLAALHAGIDRAQWQRSFTLAYQDLLRQVEQLEQRLPHDFCPDDPDHDIVYQELAGALPLDPYAATHPAEFFAVASEAFFITPAALRSAYPEIHALLGAYYLQNP